MNVVVKFLILLSLILSSQLIAAAQPVTLKAAIPSSIPPYVIKSSQSGIVLDIIRSIYRQNGFNVAFSFLPNHRAVKEFLAKKHALAFAIPNNIANAAIFYSEPLLSFKNVAISLASNNLELLSVADLKNLRITAFQNATNFLGEPFKALVKDNLYYQEITHQQHQLTLLLKGRTDVIVLEERIFLYHLKHLKLAAASSNKFRIHPIFKAAKRYCAFHSARHRDLFNQGLQHIQQTLEYQAIIDKYTR